MIKKITLAGKSKLLLVVPLIFLIFLIGPYINAKSDNKITVKNESKTVQGAKTTITPTSESSPTPVSQAFNQNRKVSIGITVDDYSNSSGELSDLESVLSNKLTAVSIYKQFGLPYNNNLDQSALNYIKSKGMELIIAWEPWDPRLGMNQTTDYLKEIVNGSQDGYIKSFAGQIKAYGGLVTLRFGHEMNGNWYPWGGRPGDYVAAYRRIFELFRNEGVGNVKWMWSINASPMVNFDSYYPGQSYVDLIGIDGYNYGNTNTNSTWVNFDQVFAGAYNYVSSRYAQPVYITEVASAEQGGDKAQWITNMFRSASSMPKIIKIIWFNLNKERDWRIQSSQNSLKAFQAGI